MTGRKKWTASEMGRKGGKARAAALSPERRKEIATKASRAAAVKRSACEYCGAEKGEACNPDCSTYFKTPENA